MKAMILTKFGSPDGFRLMDVPKPTPKDNEILIKICATSITAGDTEIRGLTLPLLFAIPIRLFLEFSKGSNKILGQELAGIVEETGKDVTQFKKGDAVFGTSGFGLGGYAEYICLPAQSEDRALALKPTNVTFEQAAVVPTAGLEALHFLRLANIQKGAKVLVFGAGGSIGTFGVQLAKHFGAEVTGLDSSVKMDTLRSIGADHVIDYTKEDFTRNGEAYDVIFDVIGKSSFSGCIRSLKPNGCYLMANFKPSYLIRRLFVSGGKKVIMGSAIQSSKDLTYLKELIEAGTIKPVIDRDFLLEQIADAHRYAESGKKKGNIAITVAAT